MDCATLSIPGYDEDDMTDEAEILFALIRARYAARLSGAHALSLMMLDVFSTFKELKICTAYELDGQRITNFPFHADDLRRVKPIYETLPGWQEEITRVQSVDEVLNDIVPSPAGR